MDEPLVVREPLDRQGVVGRPLGPAVLVDTNPCVAEVGQPASERRDVVGVAVEDDLAAGDDVLRVQQPHDLGVVDARQPGARKRDSSRDVTASSLSVRAPAVVRVQRPDVDDRQVGIGESCAQLGGGDDVQDVAIESS